MSADIEQLDFRFNFTNDLVYRALFHKACQAPEAKDLLRKIARAPNADDASKAVIDCRYHRGNPYMLGLIYRQLDLNASDIWHSYEKPLFDQLTELGIDHETVKKPAGKKQLLAVARDYFQQKGLTTTAYFLSQMVDGAIDYRRARTP